MIASISGREKLLMSFSISFMCKRAAFFRQSFAKPSINSCSLSGETPWNCGGVGCWEEGCESCDDKSFDPEVLVDEGFAFDKGALDDEAFEEPFPGAAGRLFFGL